MNRFPADTGLLHAGTDLHQASQITAEQGGGLLLLTETRSDGIGFCLQDLAGGFGLGQIVDAGGPAAVPVIRYGHESDARQSLQHPVHAVIDFLIVKEMAGGIIQDGNRILAPPGLFQAVPVPVEKFQYVLCLLAGRPVEFLQVGAATGRIADYRSLPPGEDGLIQIGQPAGFPVVAPVDGEGATANLVCGNLHVKIQSLQHPDRSRVDFGFGDVRDAARKQPDRVA